MKNSTIYYGAGFVVALLSILASMAFLSSTPSKPVKTNPRIQPGLYIR